MSQQEDFNIIWVYKSQGEKALIEPKIYDDIEWKNIMFVFGFQSKEQLTMFEKQPHKIVCIDAAHKTNQYNFPSTNLIVSDEFTKWCDIAYRICYREDELVLIPFLQAIKEKCWNHNLEIYPVMAGNDNSRWNAFLRVTGDCTQHLCKWHVKKVWGTKYYFVKTNSCKKKYTGHCKLFYSKHYRNPWENAGRTPKKIWR